VILIGAGWYAFQQKQTTPTKIKKVTVSQAFDAFLYAPLYVAQEKGYFTDEDLDVSIVTAGGDEKAFASLISGDAQFAVGDPTFVAIAGEKGQSGKVVGALLNGVPFWGVADKLDIATIETPNQLGTHSVATFPSPSTAYALQKKMFESAGLKPNIKEIAPGALIPALKGGSVDIALELEPDVSIAVNNGSHIVFSLSKYYPDFAITGITVLPSFAQNNPETIQKFINAIQKADKYIRSNPEDAATIVADRFPDVPKDVALKAMKNVVSANVIPENLVTSENGWNTAIQLRRDTGDIKQAAPFTTYIDNSFAEKAK
jgi:NitT/TauT family transport system substrate-binding protein